MDTPPEIRTQSQDPNVDEPPMYPWQAAEILKAAAILMEAAATWSPPTNTHSIRKDVIEQALDMIAVVACDMAEFR